MHIIRLRGPWQLFPVDAPESADLEVPVPGDWSALGADFAGPACFLRRFGLPTNLSHERVALVVEQVHARATIELNGQALGTQSATDGPRSYEITALLRPRNELRIVLELAGHSGSLPGVPGPGSLGEVRLEIAD